MQQQIQALLSAGISYLQSEYEHYATELTNTAFWQNSVARLEPWREHIQSAVPRVPKRLIGAAFIILLVGLALGLRGHANGAAIANDNELLPKPTTVVDDRLVPEDQAVICIGVVRFTDGMLASVFQKGGESFEETLIRQTNAELVRQGYTIEYHNCYGNWQDAADFLTDGQVTLPENANEQVFTSELMKWKQQQMMNGQ